MSDLPAFLKERIDEDERRACGWLYWFLMRLRVRLLREVEAKRRIILDEHRQGDGDSIWCRVCDPAADMNDSDRWYPCRTVRLLGAVYRDHPDYDEAWTDGAG